MEKGASLDPQDLSMMENFLRGWRKLKLFMNGKEGYAPTLSSYSLNITDLIYIEDEINISISGNRVDSNASKELKKIRKQIDICEDRIKEKLEKFLKNPVNKEYIQEFFVSKRNGKYTIPIKSAFKNQVQGESNETSSKGSTVFVEPNVVDRYTSELATLKVEEAIEEYKILATLTEMLYEKIKEIKINIDIIAEYDMIWEKAKYSSDIEVIKPKLNEHGYTKIVKLKELEVKASELYPEGYDLNQLFVSFKERKLERHIERGSKKALKELKKNHLK